MKHNQPIQISIPTPCHEDWGKMTPQEQGRFCNSCQKCVVDFTGFSDAQLYQFLADRKGQKICGRFSSTQLNRQINIPHQPHSTLYKWVIAAGLVLIFSMTSKEKIFAQAPHSQPQIAISTLSSIDTGVLNAKKEIRLVDSVNNVVSSKTDTTQPVLYIIDGMVVPPKESLDPLITPHQNSLPAKYSNHNKER